jgi:sterol desaturase/sphingolipid hydroxylase (fatty acid hydroxylase superfamily)
MNRRPPQPRRTRELSPTISIALIVVTAGLLAWLERRRPLRRRREPDAPHVGRNLAVAGLGVLALQLAERPIVSRLSALVVRRQLGLLQQWRLPAAVATLLAVALLDYTLYLWHVLVHRVPVLWRTHAVHHVDRDLDASTAIRFHFAELVASVPWRAAQVVAIGVGPYPLSVWRTFLMMNILFHHSNVDLPPAVERIVNRIVVTPRMHGIHHSRVAAEVDSNWSSGLTIWDRLHRTLKLNVPQQSIEVGVPGFDSDERVALKPMLALPFTAEEVAPAPEPGHAIASVPADVLVP